jgi:hypothetical protein
MVDFETLLDLGLTSLVLPAWPVMLYVVFMSLFVLMHKIRLCLLTSYLFTFYWGFSLHWSDLVIAGEGFTIAFIIYSVAGLAIAGLVIAASFSGTSSPKETSAD